MTAEAIARPETLVAEVDAATVEVIRHYLVSAAREMERVLVRTAYSTIIYEINDFGLSIFDRAFRLLADSTGLPVFLGANERSEEHTSELQSLMRISYAVFCLKKKKIKTNKH